MQNQYLVLLSKDGHRIEVDRQITKMSTVLNDAIDDQDFETDGWPEVPCYMVNR